MIDPADDQDGNLNGDPDGGAACAHVDVLIVGAGLSGIGSAWRLRGRCPERSFLILEARETPGWAWDLLRYPGIRSDSDMFTFGYPFRAWRGDPR